MAAEDIPQDIENDHQQIAPLIHTIGLLLIFTIVALLGAYFQSRPSGASVSATQVHDAIPLYISLIIMEWALIYYIWFGIRKGSKTKLLQVVGGRWSNWREVSIDLAIAIPFWFIWEMTAKFVGFLLGPSQAKSIQTLLPQGLIEILLWVVLSISAGLSEEITFRGYLQKQAAAFTRSTAAAVLIQAVIFGSAHAYQGLKNVITIFVLGVLYGALAAWRKNLRPGMIAHAFSDINGGLLRFL